MLEYFGSILVQGAPTTFQEYVRLRR